MTTNTMTIAGDLSTDPQIRYSRDGVAETTLTVSVEQPEDDSTTVTVICLGELAENVALSLVRHARIVASGRARTTNRSPEDVYPVRQFELLADEIGASLRSATVDIHKVTRSMGQS